MTRPGEIDWRARAEKAEAEVKAMDADAAHFARCADKERLRAEAAEKRAAALEELAKELIRYLPEGFVDKLGHLGHLSALLAPPLAPKSATAPLGSRCLATSPAGHTCSLPAGHPGGHHGGPQPGYTFR